VSADEEVQERSDGLHVVVERRVQAGSAGSGRLVLKGPADQLLRPEITMTPDGKVNIDGIIFTEQHLAALGLRLTKEPLPEVMSWTGVVFQARYNEPVMGQGDYPTNVTQFAGMPRDLFERFKDCLVRVSVMPIGWKK